MSNFKISGMGLDLRNPKVKVFKTDDIDTKLLKGVEYIIVDVMSCKDHLTHDFIENMVVNNETIPVATLDLSLVSSCGRTTLSSAKNLYLDWKLGYWKLPTLPGLLLLSNLPSRPEKGVQEIMYFEEDLKNFNDISTIIGLEIKDLDKGLEELENWKNVFGKYPIHVARPCSPLQYNVDLENKLRELDCTVWGLDCYGNRVTEETSKEAFTIPFLLSFASYHSSVVLVPIYKGMTIDHLSECNYLKDLRERKDEISELEESKYILKKSINRLVKIPKQIVKNCLKMENGWEIDCTDSELMFSPFESSLVFGKVKSEFTGSKRRVTDLEQEIFDLTANIYKEKNYKKYYWRAITLVVADKLGVEFPEKDRWKIDYCSLGEYTLAITITQTKKKNWINKSFPDEIINTRNFILALGDRDNVYFVDLDMEVDFENYYIEDAEIEQITPSKES